MIIGPSLSKIAHVRACERTVLPNRFRGVAPKIKKLCDSLAALRRQQWLGRFLAVAAR